MEALTWLARLSTRVRGALTTSGTRPRAAGECDSAEAAGRIAALSDQVTSQLESLARTRLATFATSGPPPSVPTGADDPSLDSDDLQARLSRLEALVGALIDQARATSKDLERIRGAIDALEQGVVVQDDEGEILCRNATAAALIGSRHTDLLVARAIEDQLRSTLRATPSERTLELYGPPRRTLVVRTRPLGSRRSPLGVVAILEDVSQQRRLEAIRRDFVANVSHELKTPVAALALLAETLVAETDPEVTARLADRINFEAVRVGNIISDLLDLSRIEADEMAPAQVVNLSEIMAESIERASPAAERRSVELKVEQPDHDLCITGDRRQLVSAVHNLLENAIKYSDEHSLVEATIYEAGPFFDIVVRDQGIGIPAHDLGRIFERFYRVDQARSRSSGGTGLGLAIVRHVAANHGGEVLVESREGEGSAFTLRFPKPEAAESDT